MAIRPVDPGKYDEFEIRFTALFYEIFGENPTKWVIPVISLDNDLKSLEDILVPDSQLVQDTLGMLRWAQVELEASIMRGEID